MIAGTSFVLCNARDVWGQLLHRIARTNSPLQVLDAAVKADEDENAVSLCCDDGLVMMTLTTSADGTITAMVLMAASFGIGGAFKRRETEMMAIARDAGASRLAFRTDRKGWGRLLGPEWRLDGETFSRSL
jgi:hypothetical protein